MEVSWWYFSSIGGQHASQALTILAIGDARLEMAARKGSGPRSPGGQERILLTECPFTSPEHTNTNINTNKNQQITTHIQTHGNGIHTLVAKNRS